MKRINNSPEVPLPESEVIDVQEVYASWRRGEIDLVCVLGPTASGKTRYAVALARELNRLAAKGGRCEGSIAEIISADSRPVYRGMDIGTGKDLDEYGEIPFHMIDIVDAGEKYDLYCYQRDFEAVYASVRERGHLPILCGGTGLYIQAVLSAYSLPDVPPSRELRSELEQTDIEELREAYAERFGSKADPEVMVSKKRLIRALEVELSEGPVTRTSYEAKKAFIIGTLVSREERNFLIDKRLDQRLESGLIEEVRSLLESGVGSDDLIYYGLEYKFVTQYLLGLIDKETMRLQLSTAIHQFAKRQMTFFRSMESKGFRIHWTRP
jgi:tRNA dimethylallyltransferase